MKTNVPKAICLGVCILLTGCMKAENRWGGVSGSQPLQTNFPFQLCYVLQGDRFSGTYDPSKNRPLFAVLWEARRAGQSEHDGNNRLFGIHGHRIAASFVDRAVYALQPDYSLRRLPLSAAEVDQILESFMVKGDSAVAFDDLWHKKVLPELSTIEDPTWTPPPNPGGL